MKAIQKSAVLFIISIMLLSILPAGCSKYDDKLNEELIKAIGQKDVAKVKELLAKNANPNAIDGKGNPMISKVMTEMTISMDEMSSGSISGSHNENEIKEIVKMLVNAGADVTLKNKEGIPIIISALPRGDKEIINLLIAEGADVNDKDSTGMTVLIAALFGGSDDVVRTLIEKGAEINEVQKDGATPLIVATYRNRPGLAELLINKGADVKVKMGIGSPLFFAAAYGNLNLVKLLVEKGADINFKDNQGYSIVATARERKQTEVVDYLVKAGAKE